LIGKNNHLLIYSLILIYIYSIEAVGKNKQKEMEGLQEVMRYKIAMINNSKAAAK